jgi:hypothetical protein
MAGFGSTCKITPVYSSRVHLAIVGNLANATINDSAYVILRYGTGTAPVNGAAVAGTAVTGELAGTSSTATGALPFNASGVVVGLTVGVAIWFDLSYKANAGTATMNGLSCNVFEF